MLFLNRLFSIFFFHIYCVWPVILIWWLYISVIWTAHIWVCRPCRFLLLILVFLWLYVALLGAFCVYLCLSSGGRGYFFWSCIASLPLPHHPTSLIFSFSTESNVGNPQLCDNSICISQDHSEPELGFSWLQSWSHRCLVLSQCIVHIHTAIPYLLSQPQPDTLLTLWAQPSAGL